MVKKLRCGKLKNKQCADGFEWAVFDTRGHLVATMATKGNSKATAELVKTMCVAFNNR